MPIQGRYLFTASMDVRADKDALFNEVYDAEHVPLLSEVPGVVSVARFKTQELTLAIGGELRTIVVENEPRYTAVYEPRERRRHHGRRMGSGVGARALARGGQALYAEPQAYAQEAHTARRSRLEAPRE